MSREFGRALLVGVSLILEGVRLFELSESPCVVSFTSEVIGLGCDCPGHAERIGLAASVGAISDGGEGAGPREQRSTEAFRSCRSANRPSRAASYTHP